MEKIIKRTISLTTKKRDSRNKLFEEFYSHDKNTATFEFTVEGGVPTEDIVVLFHFKRTNRHLEVRGRVDNDKIIVNFDTSLIIKDEQVAGYIYYENGEKSNDVYRFMFDVHVSEIDKEHDLPVMEMESKRIVPLTDIVTKSEITELLKKIVANEKLYDDAEIRGQIATKADNQIVEAIAQRVKTLENKTDNDTVYNDTELRQAVEAKADKQALLQYLQKSELIPLSDKVQSIETNIGRMATQQQLESYVSKNELEQKGYLTSADTRNFALKSEIPEVPNLDTVNEKIRALAEKQPVDLSYLATKKEIEDSHYLTREDINGLATNLKVEAVESRLQQLENKPPVELSNLATKQDLEAVRNIDTSNLVKKQELEDKHYLTTQNLAEYAKKTEIPNIDTSSFVSKQELSNMHLVNSEELGNVSKKMLEQTTKITALESKAEFEIHGTGIPNGTVSAPIGTTYVDTAVTNGALKWIKQSGTGNTGWKVLIGDTGWRTLNSISKLTDGSRTSTIKIRRVNNLVTYNFGGLQWGWFGIVRRNGKGFARHNSSGDRGVKVLGVSGIPLGFRSEASLIGGIYNDAGKPYGIWYLGGATDSNFIQFTFNDPIPTDRDIGDIRVSAISYLTDDDWPTVLP